MSTLASPHPASAPPAAADAPYRRPGWQLVLNVLIAAVGVAFVVGGLAATIAYRVVDVPNSDRYVNAPQCAVATEALTQQCWAVAGARVAAAALTYESDGAPHWRVWLTDLTGMPLTPQAVDVVDAGPAFDDLRAGDPVALKVYDGRATLLRSVPDPGITRPRTIGAMLLAGNPLADQDLQLIGGGSLIAAGAVLLVLVLPTTTPSGRFVRWFGPPGAPSLWSSPGGMVSRVMSDRMLLIGFIVLVLMQALDVVSSVAGNASGLAEANPINRTMLVTFGAAGFVITKLPAVLAILLIMGRMPRRLALGLAWVANAGMVYVVVGNLLLVNGAPPA